MGTVVMSIGALLACIALGSSPGSTRHSEPRLVDNCALAPSCGPRQVPSRVRVAIAQDTAAQRRLVTQAVARFVPWLQDSIAKQGTLFVIVDAEGRPFHAVFGSLEDYERAKAKIEDFDLRVGSMSIVKFAAGVIVPQKLNAAIVELK